MFTTCFNFILFESDLKIELQKSVSCFLKRFHHLHDELALVLYQYVCLLLVGVKVDSAFNMCEKQVKH